MEKNDRKAIQEKNGYIFSKELFFNSLLSEPEGNGKVLKEEELLQRDLLYKMKVLQVILFLDVPGLTLSGDERKAMKDKELIGVKVENEGLLFGYTFHVSSNPEFKHTWNYMRKQLDKFANFLFDAKRFFEYVFRDITALTDVLKDLQGIHIVFNELVDVAYMDNTPNILVKMQWDKFHNIAKVGNGYNVSVMVKGCTLTVYNCSYKDKVDKLCEKVKRMKLNFEFGNRENNELHN